MAEPASGGSGGRRPSSRLRFYAQQTGREARRRKCSSALGCFSVFLVVVVAASCKTFIDNSSGIYLQIAEAEHGQFDMKIHSSQSDVAPFLNYSQIQQHLILPSQEATESMSYSSYRLSLRLSTFYPLPCTRLVMAAGYEPAQTDWLYDSEAASRLFSICNTSAWFQTPVHLIHSQKEARMGFGRKWNLGDIPAKSIVLSKAIASNLSANVGDTIFVSLFEPELFLAMISPSSESRREVISKNARSINALKVHAIVSEGYGKFSQEMNLFAVMETTPFLSSLSGTIDPRIYAEEQSLITDAKLEDFASFVYFNLPPSRVKVYITESYENIQKRLVTFASSILFLLGFSLVESDLPLLEFLNESQLYSLYLGLILQMILVILFLLSTLLLHSLLVISVETRTFELGILRMIGINTKSLLALLFTQALSYSVVPWAVGLAASSLVSLYSLSVLQSLLGVPIARSLTAGSVVLGTVLGLGIPIIASVAPITNALTTNLHDALDTRHSKTKAVKISIQRSQDQPISPTLVVTGLGLSVFGFCIYYLVPLSLISGNLPLFFNIFFCILFGMLLGLLIISLNFEHLMEHLVVLLFLRWWENPPIPALVLKNLIAHRLRNRKTAMMYALAVGFIIFISVSFSLELKTSEFRSRRSAGADMHITAFDAFPRSQASALEAFVASGPSGIDTYTWRSNVLTSSVPSLGVSSVRNLGHYFGSPVSIRAVSPAFFERSDRTFLDVRQQHKQSGGLSISEQLFSIAGSQAVVLGSSFQDFLQLHSLTDELLVRFDSVNVSRRVVSRCRPLAFLDSAPALHFSPFPSEIDQTVLVSFPTYINMSQGRYRSIRDIPLDRLMIRFKSSASDVEKDAVMRRLSQISPSPSTVWDYREVKESLEATNKSMSLVFSIATYVAMVLCMFSLMASMTTSIREQTKEIAVLRSLGLRSRQLTKLYFYEAFVLVVSASILGILIGSLLAWTMLQQRSLFTKLPLPMIFPTNITVAVLSAALLCAFVSTIVPASRLAKQPISKVFRNI